MRRALLSPNAAVLAGCLAVAAAVGLSTSAAPASADGHRANALVDRWIDVMGGMETYRQLRSASFTVTTILYDTVSGREKRRRPRYVWIKKGPDGEQTRVERWETGGLIQQGFNGRDPAWAAVDGQMLPDTAKDAREALYVSRDLFYWFGLPFKLRDPGVFLADKGLQSLPAIPQFDRRSGDRKPTGRYRAVGVSFDEGVGEHQDVFTYYFEPSGGRPSPVQVTYMEEGRGNLNRLVWGETVRTGAIRYPYVVRRDWITASGKRTKALVFSDVAINPDLPQRLFDRP